MPSQINWMPRIIVFSLFILLINLSFYGQETLSFKDSVNIALGSDRGFFSLGLLTIALFHRMQLTDLFFACLGFMLGLLLNPIMDELKMAIIFTITILISIKMFEILKKT